MQIKIPLLAVLFSTIAATSLGACGSDNSSSGGCNNNGVREGDEQCDGQDINNKTCSMLLMMQATGTVTCSSTCQFVTTACMTGSGAGGNGTGGGGNGTGGA